MLKPIKSVWDYLKGRNECGRKKMNREKFQYHVCEYISNSQSLNSTFYHISKSFIIFHSKFFQTLKTIFITSFKLASGHQQ